MRVRSPHRAGRSSGRPASRRGSRQSLTTLAAAGLVVLFVVPGTARADSSACSKEVRDANGAIKYAHCAGLAEFTSYGDRLTIDDHVADTFPGVVLWWRSDGTGPFVTWNKESAKGPVVEAPVGNLREGDWIFYQVCIGRSGEVFRETCSDGVTDYA